MFTKFGWVWFKGLDFHFLTPAPHFGRYVFAFLVFWGLTNYVYKICLSLLKWPRFLFFDSPLILAPEQNMFAIIGSVYSIFHFSCSSSLTSLNDSHPISPIIWSKYSNLGIPIGWFFRGKVNLFFWNTILLFNWESWNVQC